MIYHYQRRYRGRIQLAIFDWAGTTVDFGCQAPIIAFVEGFRRKGVEVSLAAARGPMGMEKREHIKTVIELEEVAKQFRVAHGRDATEEDIDALFDDFVPMLLEILEDRSQIIPGVPETIETLRETGMKIGASTGYFNEAAEIVVKAGKQSGYSPDYVINASEVPAGRPEPWMIFRVMEGLGVYPPESVVNVGDTEVDVESGLNAGVWSVGVAATGNTLGLTLAEYQELEPLQLEQRLAVARDCLYRAGAHYVINTMQELPGVIENINDRLECGDKP